MDHLYAYSKAPAHKGFPNIVTLCSPAQRRKLYRSVLRKIIDGKWNGAWLTPRKRRGVVRIRLHKHSKQLVILAYHVVLVANGYFPHDQRRYCSHLCHNPRCMRVEHLCWSDSNDNMLRELCRTQGRCVCGLPRACSFDCT